MPPRDRLRPAHVPEREVVAVHGNDERLEETQRELAYQQVLAIVGPNEHTLSN